MAGMMVVSLDATRVETMAALWAVVTVVAKVALMDVMLAGEMVAWRVASLVVLSDEM